MSKRYILQKDLPDVKAGAVFEWGDNRSYRYHVKNTTIKYWFEKEYVENNPEWFLPEDEFGKWVSGRYPQSEGYYLGYYKNSQRYVVLMFKYGSWFNGDDAYVPPFAWMPLPEPYKPE